MAEQTEVQVVINADRIDFRIADFANEKTQSVQINLADLMSAAKAGDSLAENSLMLWVVQGHLGQLNRFLEQQQIEAATRVAEAQDPQAMASKVTELIKTLADNDKAA